MQPFKSPSHALGHNRRQLLLRGLAATAAIAEEWPAHAATRGTKAEQLHAAAVDSFRKARFPEAFGRFVALADAGHAPSGRIALWMWQQGPDLFGKDWDCSPDQLEDWSRLAGVPTPPMQPSLYGRHAIGGADSRSPRSTLQPVRR